MGSIPLEHVVIGSIRGTGAYVRLFEFITFERRNARDRRDGKIAFVLREIIFLCLGCKRGKHGGSGSHVSEYDFVLRAVGAGNRFADIVHKHGIYRPVFNCFGISCVARGDALLAQIFVQLAHAGFRFVGSRIEDKVVVFVFFI